jgi:hypothetical protein
MNLAAYRYFEGEALVKFILGPLIAATVFLLLVAGSIEPGWAGPSLPATSKLLTDLLTDRGSVLRPSGPMVVKS